MASLKWHIAPTTLVAIISMVCAPITVLFSKNMFVLLAVIGMGIFVDLDHRIIRRRADGGFYISGAPIEGCTNWLHTWQMMIGIIILSILLMNPLPLISFVVHILIDGANRANIRWPKWSPLPMWINKFFPRWMTYYY